MLIALAGLALLAAIVLPQLLVRLTFSRHAADRPDIPGTGGELARHLLDSFGLGHVRVEVTDRGDHYDPRDKAVRLGERNLNGHSLTAVAVAAHEVSHALQDDRGERSFTLWQRLAALAASTDRIAGLFFIAAPILAIFARTPMALIALVLVGVALLAVRVVVTLVTLPIEFDASFGKALPILGADGYLEHGDLPAARGVLRAAAFTYVAGALIGLLNFLRILRIIR